MMNKSQIFILLLTIAAGVKCMQKCISDAIFLQNENLSLIDDDAPNATVFSAADTVINVKNLNDTDLPYNVAPEISTYERGKGLEINSDSLEAHEFFIKRRSRPFCGQL
jgi:hypothetical protein